MDQASSRRTSCSQEGFIRDKVEASKRIVRSKVAVELHLLPTDVLCDVLSRLSLKQAVRMSGVSREWRRLGICHPDLVFTEDTFFGSKSTRYTDPRSVAPEFITSVDNVLRPLWSTSTTTATTVGMFVVKFSLGRHHTHHIDRWIDFSTASKAKHLGLDLGWSGREEDLYVVPLCKLSGPDGSCIKSLDMTSVVLKLPPSFRGITNLRKLSLHEVSVDASDLQGLLVTCAFLESLSLDFCPLSSLSVQEELCQLQYLSVRECEVQIFSKSHATFINLRHLNLNIDVVVSYDDTNWVMALVKLLELAPLLEELELHIACDRSGLLNRIVTAVPGPLHRHLRSIHVTGFCDFVGIAELALYILENATVLECMVLDPVLWMEYGYPNSGQFYSVSKAGSSEEFVRPKVTEEELRGREFAKKHLDREEFCHILTIL